VPGVVVGGEAASGAASEESSTTTEDDVSELVSIEAVWRDRAKCAEEAAQELAELSSALRAVLRRNYFGLGCVEGAVLYERLRTIIGGGAEQLSEMSDACRNLAGASRSAAAHYVANDAAVS
jgi:hypothetical protein